MLYVHMGEDNEFRILVASLEELRVQIYRKIVHLVLRKCGLFNFLLGLLFWTGEVLGSVIAAARLQSQLLRTFQRDLQAVKTAIQFKLLRSKRQNIGILRRLGHTSKAF